VERTEAARLFARGEGVARINGGFRTPISEPERAHPLRVVAEALDMNLPRRQSRAEPTHRELLISNRLICFAEREQTELG